MVTRNSWFFSKLVYMLQWICAYVEYMELHVGGCVTMSLKRIEVAQSCQMCLFTLLCYDAICLRIRDFFCWFLIHSLPCDILSFYIFLAVFRESLKLLPFLAVKFSIHFVVNFCPCNVWMFYCVSYTILKFRWVMYHSQFFV